MQVFEDALHRSGMVYNDPELEARLYSLIPIEQLGEKAKGFRYRIYVLRDPELNAMIAPTGTIYINSGLLAALEDMDQLRLVIGHEAHHLIDQDIVHYYQKIKNEVGAIKVLQLIAAPAVAVAIAESDSSTAATIANVYTAANLAVSITYQASVSGYGRDNENECDQFALKIFKENSYDYRSARRVFQLFEEEEKRYAKGFQYHLFRTHDSGKKRADQVDQFMKDHGYVEPVDPRPQDEYEELTRKVRLENARLNIRIKRIQHALDGLGRLDRGRSGDPVVQFLYGEAYAALASDDRILKDELNSKEWRKLGIKDLKAQTVVWRNQALEYYRKAIELDVTYADPHRGIALLKEGVGELQEAMDHYKRYLQITPEPPDKRYVQAKIDRLTKKLATPVPTKEEK
ncbi:MAG: Beta-barrel assembly-enhancing protease [Candidatus Omnitrophica bacterium]|nr:Beta-barrel assembly-enhancing protease [Candidatus Omnitrophota bacterium]